MKSLKAETVLANQLERIQKAERITDVNLAATLRDLGYETLSRDAIRAIKRGDRRVTLDETLALAWALDIAPTNLIVPFEKPDPVTRNDAGEKIDPPLYKTSATLHIGVGVDMQPVEARAWIAGRSVRHDTDREVTRRRERRFYVDHVPPPQRDAIDAAAGSAVREAAKQGHPNEIHVALPVSTWIAIESEREAS